MVWDIECNSNIFPTEINQRIVTHPSFAARTGKAKLAMPKVPSRHEVHLGVSKNTGTPKWMVYNGKPY